MLRGIALGRNMTIAVEKQQLSGQTQRASRDQGDSPPCPEPAGPGRSRSTYAGVVEPAVSPDWRSHVLLLYRDEPYRQASVVSWVQRGLERGEKVVYTHSDSDSALLSALTRHGVDVDGALQAAQFAILPLEEFYPAGGQRALVESALDQGYPAVRLSAQADAALNYLREDEYLVIEHLMDDLCTTLPVSAMCQYDAARTTGAQLVNVIETHPDAVHSAQLRLRRRGDVVTVSGEVDVTSAMTMSESLCRICLLLEPGSTVTIDATEWTFVDAAGCQALTAGTDAFRREGGAVLLRGLRPHLRKVLTLVGLHKIDGVYLDAPS